MKFKIQFLLILFSVSFSNNIFSKEINKSCDDLLNDNKFEEALKTKKNEYKSAFCHGQVNLKLHHYDDAFNDFKLADKLAKNDIDHSMANLLEGITLKEANKLDEALLHLKNSIARTQPNKTFRRLYLIEIGEILLLLAKYEDAANSFLDAYGLAANDDERAFNLDRIAFAYASMGNFTKAIEFELKANLAFERTGLLSEYADSGINLALYYLEVNDLLPAERTLLKFEKLARENGGMYYLAKALYAQSKYYKKKSNLELSKSKFDEANKIANDIGAEDLKALFNAI
jgi:tetratricopeptide (TPR) repeat protein